MPVERDTIRRIREAIRAGHISRVFTPNDLNLVLSIDWAGTFLPKHRVGNPGGNTELFVRIGPGRYRLKKAETAF